MLGQNIVPSGYHSIADGITTAQLQQFLSDLKTIIRGAVGRMPEHEAFIRAHCAAPPT